MGFLVSVNTLTGLVIVRSMSKNVFVELYVAKSFWSLVWMMFCGLA